MIKIVVLLENTKESPNLKCKHGLSLYAETETHKILFDCVHGDCLSHASDISFGHRPLCGILYAAFGAVRLNAWRENADVDMDKRTYAY